MASQRITKRVVDGLKPRETEYAVWDAHMPGFGVRVRPTGSMSYVVVYRAGAGRGAPVRRYTIAGVGKIAPESARTRAKAILARVATGHDPAGEKAFEREAITISGLADRFIAEVERKRKPGTAIFSRHLLNKIIRPQLGAIKADKLTRAQVARLHGSLMGTPFQANRVLAVIGSMYAFAGRSGIVPEGTNPTRRIDNRVRHPRSRVKGHPLGGRRRKAQGQTPAEGDGPFHEDWLIRGCRDPIALVHRLPASRNPAPQVGASGFRARPVISCRVQERQEDDNPECSSTRGPG
jgi:Arm DNA-binding domain